MERLTSGTAADSEFVLGAPVSYFRDLQQRDAVAAARTLNAPLLVLQGARDYQVTMADFAIWRDATQARRRRPPPLPSAAVAAAVAVGRRPSGIRPTRAVPFVTLSAKFRARSSPSVPQAGRLLPTPLSRTSKTGSVLAHPHMVSGRAR